MTGAGVRGPVDVLSAAAADERLSRREALFALVAEGDRWRCPSCGEVFEHQWRLEGHGYPQEGIRPFGTWCRRLWLRRNHARYALRTGDVAMWREATADLRAIGAWRATGQWQPQP
jgi:hypothetical protein